ncbi:MAG: hypothetical protein Q4E05_05670 [Pseudoclavibacter sp.]|nr:hypothetical protein [Pseudoclavibacter sp.]
MGRRVRTEPVPGADPAPQSYPDSGPRAPEPVPAAEDLPGSWGDPAAEGSNTERLLSERPPHHG